MLKIGSMCSTFHLHVAEVPAEQYSAVQCSRYSTGQHWTFLSIVGWHYQYCSTFSNKKKKRLARMDNNNFLHKNYKLETQGEGGVWYLREVPVR